jgi:hypothetical protein
MEKICLYLSVASALLHLAAAQDRPQKFQVDVPSSVSFSTTDKDLQKLYDVGAEELLGNLTEFAPGFTILVEGGGYDNAWLETQPMGGEMFAKQNIQVALNNQLAFMLTQRDDGRLPGMVIKGSKFKEKGWDEKGLPAAHVWRPELGLVADFEMFQGYCFPEPAWRMYFWAGKPEGYLQDLYQALKGHDDYLWSKRDSNNDGLLETWCVWDTGEDASTRLYERGMRDNWPYEHAPGSGHPDIPPLPEGAVAPFQSMDVMAYSYSGRAVLAKVSAELGNGEAAKWSAAAEEVRQQVIDKLWDPGRHACFDRDRNGKVLDELIHNNLRCMWYGMFTQDMADEFIRHHLLNPDAFWTPVPLVSIAIHEPLFQSKPRNNWSGQPQGLTYQRAIGALENYGHVAEVTLLGEKLLPVLIRNGFKFSQQLDPITGEPSLSNSDGYGPMILAMQAYIARMHGVHIDVEKNLVWWSAISASGEDFSYDQRWAEHQFSLAAKDGKFTASVNGKQVFEGDQEVRVVTDLQGKLISVVGISPEPQAVRIATNERTWTGRISPNEVKQFASDGLTLVRDVPFDYPYQAPEN